MPRRLRDSAVNAPMAKQQLLLFSGVKVDRISVSVEKEKSDLFIANFYPLSLSRLSGRPLFCPLACFAASINTPT